jgi:hypothetical protein
MRTRLLALLLLLVTPALASADEAYRVIAHPDTKIASVDRTFLRDVFLKKATRWPGDELVRPVDHGPETAVRRKFSQDVIGRSVTAVKSYWQSLIFAGRDIPPPELDTDAQIVAYVQKHPGAIGYVSPSADVSGVKLLTVK